VPETAFRSPARSSFASLSLKVPFFHHIKAMRRQGEFNKAPDRGMGYTDIETASTRLTGDKSSNYARSVTSFESDHVSTVYAI
jgi:hypothetical protein